MYRRVSPSQARRYDGRVSQDERPVRCNSRRKRSKKISVQSEEPKTNGHMDSNDNFGVTAGVT